MKINLLVNLNGALMGFCFEPNQVVTIGRGIGNTIAPLSADGLSRFHAKLYFKDGAWHVEDLGSTNGTFRGGKKISAPEVLAVKDKIQFGRFELTVDELIACDAPASSDSPVAPAASEPPVVSISELKPTEPVDVPSVAPVPVAPAPVVTVPVEKASADSAPVEPAPANPAPVEPAPVAAAAVSTPAPAVVQAQRPTVPIKPGVRPLPSGIKKPIIGGGALKSGLKLPPKPGLSGGLKLPPKPGLSGGLKLPPKTSVSPIKPGVKPLIKPAHAPTLKPVEKLSADVEMTPVE